MSPVRALVVSSGCDRRGGRHDADGQRTRNAVTTSGSASDGWRGPARERGVPGARCARRSTPCPACGAAGAEQQVQPGRRVVRRPAAGRLVARVPLPRLRPDLRGARALREDLLRRPRAATRRASWSGCSPTRWPTPVWRGRRARPGPRARATGSWPRSSRHVGVAHSVGVDILPEASTAAERDRPGLYADYLVTDLTALDAEDSRRLAGHRAQRADRRGRAGLRGHPARGVPHGVRPGAPTTAGSC